MKNNKNLPEITEIKKLKKIFTHGFQTRTKSKPWTELFAIQHNVFNICAKFVTFLSCFSFHLFREYVTQYRRYNSQTLFWFAYMTCAFRCVLSEFLFFFFFSSAASNTAQMRSVSALAIRLSYMPSQHVQQTCCMPCETLVFGFSLPPYFFCLAICFLPFSLSLTLTLSFHHLFFFSYYSALHLLFDSFVQPIYSQMRKWWVECFPSLLFVIFVWRNLTAQCQLSLSALFSVNFIVVVVVSYMLFCQSNLLAFSHLAIAEIQDGVFSSGVCFYAGWWNLRFYGASG